MIVYKGPSRLDGKPIVVILIGRTKNRKTGDMIQSYIIRSDISPVDALKNGSDASVCGDCVHRGVATGTGIKGRSCYVTVFQGPFAVYRAYKAGKYPKLSKKKAIAMLSGRMLRLGTYGDPAAVPIQVWNELISLAKDHTSYTHQWRNHDELKPISMASVDSLDEAMEAKAKGWRYFRIRQKDEAVLPTEVICPASAEAGKKSTCEKCRLCQGTNKQAKDVVIIAHGSIATVANAQRTLISLGLNKLH